MIRRLGCFATNKIKYIILYENGRLGNQFFQYLAVRTAFPSAQIVCIGLRSLLESLDSRVYQEAPSMRGSLLQKIFGRLGRKKALELATRLKLWGVITDVSDHENCRPVLFSQGLCAELAIVDGFFQNEALLDTISFCQYPLRDELMENARKWIAVNVLSRQLHPYFLHLRRGDYVRWPNENYPAVLPFRWYEQQINEISRVDENAHFIVCTDDPPYAEERFGSSPQVSIFRGSEIEDFFLMTQCSGGGILSASTFSWWAAWYGKQFFPPARYLAPMFWAGWRRGVWFPPAFETSWLDYRAVCCCQENT